jgi:hypothetical protein
VVGLLLKAIPYGREESKVKVDAVGEAADVYKKLLEED